MEKFKGMTLTEAIETLNAEGYCYVVSYARNEDECDLIEVAEPEDDLGYYELYTGADGKIFSIDYYAF